jgi:DNA repair protein RadA/Sms
MDLALVAAILSSFYDIPLPERAVLWGEVDLNGQIRPVQGQHIRLAQAGRLGYRPVLHPLDPANPGHEDGVLTVAAVQARLFRRSARHDRAAGAVRDNPRPDPGRRGEVRQEGNFNES